LQGLIGRSIINYERKGTGQRLRVIRLPRSGHLKMKANKTGQCTLLSLFFSYCPRLIPLLFVGRGQGKDKKKEVTVVSSAR
jgi:hypothetical protein